jgi:drug/metabolite transporter (DMT)-like permease
MKNAGSLSTTQAFVLALCTYTLFSISDATAKWLQMQGYSGAQILVTVNLFGLTLMMILSAWQRGRKNMFKSTRWKILFTRGVVLAINTVLIMYALKTSPLADFYGMVFVGPIWIAIFSFLFLKESIPPSRWVAILVGFLGVLVIAGPHFGAFNTGYLALAISPLFYAGSAIIARRVGKDEPITNFSLATHSCMAIINLPHAIYSFIMPSLHDFMFMMLYACVVSCGILGIGAVFARFSQPSLIAPLQYTQMLWGVLFGWMFFGVLPDISVLAGAGLIIAAGVYVLHSARKKPNR